MAPQVAAFFAFLYTFSFQPYTKTMPELPEVETVVRELNSKLKGKKIVSV
jgi:hypothetical protein